MDKQVAAEKLAKLFFATETVNKSTEEARQILAEIGNETAQLVAVAVAEKLHSDPRTAIRLFVKKYNTEAYDAYVARCGYKAA